MNIQKLLLIALLAVCSVNAFANDAEISLQKLLKSDEGRERFLKITESSMKLFFEQVKDPVHGYLLLKSHFEQADTLQTPESRLKCARLVLIQGIIDNAILYNECGVLGGILDIFFNVSGMTPNTSYAECPSPECGDISFFNWAATRATYDIRAKVLFEKLQERGGDVNLPFAVLDTKGLKLSTLDNVKRECDFYCGDHPPYSQSCKEAKDIFARLTKKTEQNK